MRKVLVVIDDIDDVNQLDSLLPQCGSSCELHHESLVIATSRNNAVLDARCTTIWEMQLLPEGRDHQLLKAWAFAAGPPVWDMSLLVPDMVACCGRLPLTLKVGHYLSFTSLLRALERPCLRFTYLEYASEAMCFAFPQVLGVHLRSLRGQEREQKMWHEALKMLREAKNLPTGRDQLFARLRISYDALDGNQKRMFLGAAFFFLDRDVDTALHAWEGYGCTAEEHLLESILTWSWHVYWPFRGIYVLPAKFEIKRLTQVLFWHRSDFSWPNTDLHVLVSYCLVQVTGKHRKCMSMHDQLRDLAYSIVREESSSIAQRTRLLGSDAEHALETGV